MSVQSFFAKMRGTTRGSPPRVATSEVAWSWLGAAFGMGALSWLDAALFRGTDLTLVIGPFGASAVLLYGASRSPLAQPRNLIGGQILSAIIGVAAWKLLHQTPWLAQTLSVATAIAVMHLTRTLHPPGGATALTAVIGSQKIHDLGFVYVLMPVTLGCLILLLVALVLNNLAPSRRYPEIWF